MRFMLVDRPFVVWVGQLARRGYSGETSSSAVDDVRVGDERELCEFDAPLRRRVQQLK